MALGKRGRSYNSGPYKKRYVRARAARAAATSRRTGTTYVRSARYRSGAYGRYVGLGGTELKYIDASVVGIPLVSTPYQRTSFNAMAQGADVHQRIGNKFVVKSLQLRGKLHWDGYNSTNAPPSAYMTNRVRFIVYQDKQMNGTKPALTDLLQDMSADGVNAVDWPYDIDDAARFRILKDKLYTLNRDQATTWNSSTNFQIFNVSEKAIHINWYWKLHVPVDHNGALASTANIRNNNLGMFIIVERDDTGVTATATFTGRMRMRFIG